MGAPPHGATASTRPPLVDGIFYPARRDALAAQIDDLLARSTEPRGAAFGVVVPHAGYEYAGDVMAAAYRSIALRRVRTAVIMGPVHRDASNAVFLPESEAFATPLGDVPIDTGAAEALLKSDALFRRSDIPHLEEHCLELQIPFLARMFPGLSIVPLLVGNDRAATAAALARSLRLTFADSGDYTVFVATANAASYMSGRDTAAESAALEEFLGRRDGAGMLAAAEKRQISACGVAGMAVLLSLAGDRCGVRVLARASSEGRDDDPSRVVRYAAVSIASASSA